MHTACNQVTRNATSCVGLACAPFLRIALIADDSLFTLEICQILEENAYQKVQAQIAEYEEC